MRSPFGIDELRNTNGSAPALTDIRKWYFADAEGKGPTVYFGDMVLEGTVAPAQVHGDPARLERIRAAAMPKIDKPILFDTPEADAIVSALEVFPPDNPWNLVIEDWPVHPNSKNIIESIGANKKFRYNTDMGYVLVPPDQKKIDVKLGSAAAESDKGPYPVPDNTPIEGYPTNYKGLTLDEVQRKDEGDIDRHALVVDPTNRMLYEFYQMRKTDKGWIASGAAIFDLKSNKLRPDGWTSADAAGLPIFPATVRYDEIKRGMVEHAMRVGVRKTRRAYVYPATHYASRDTDENLPRMGERLRLKKNFDISGFSPEAQAILKGLKKYGMFVADNGLDWTISVAPDSRIPLLARRIQQDQGFGVRGGGTQSVTSGLKTKAIKNRPAVLVPRSEMAHSSRTASRPSSPGIQAFGSSATGSGPGQLDPRRRGRHGNPLHPRRKRSHVHPVDCALVLVHPLERQEDPRVAAGELAHEREPVPG